LEHRFYFAKTWKEKHPVGSEMWSWKMMKNICWKDRGKNEQYYTE